MLWFVNNEDFGNISGKTPRGIEISVSKIQLDNRFEIFLGFIAQIKLNYSGSSISSEEFKNSLFLNKNLKVEGFDFENKENDNFKYCFPFMHQLITVYYNAEKEIYSIDWNISFLLDKYNLPLRLRNRTTIDQLNNLRSIPIASNIGLSEQKEQNLIFVEIIKKVKEILEKFVTSKLELKPAVQCVTHEKGEVRNVAKNLIDNQKNQKILVRNK